jgi:hypothetical protein
MTEPRIWFIDPHGHVRPPGQTAPPRRARRVVLAGLLVGLIAAAWATGRLLPPGHWPRLGAVLLAAGAGIGLALCRPGWVARGGWVLAGLVVAVGAWWFVPTTAGLSLWQARREAGQQAEALGSLAADDFAEFAAGRVRRAEVAAQFPQLGGILEGAERGWVERSGEAAVAEAEGVLAADPVRACRRLAKAERALTRCAADEGPLGRLRAARRRALGACLEKLRRRVLDGQEEGRFEAAAALARRLEREAGADAGIDLKRVRQSYEFLAELARRARPAP